MRRMVVSLLLMLSSILPTAAKVVPTTFNHEGAIGYSFTYNGFGKVTNLYAGDYECIDGTSYYYLDGGVIYVKLATGAGQAYYALTDHLGSYVRLYTMAGDSVFIATCDPWGNRTTTKNTLKFHRGFTGHEHLTTYGVINMNGRMYDPTVGRFLAPDTFVQMPDFSQSFNRYSYCLNNPLKYVDRDGKVFWLVPILVGAAIGAGISGTTYAVTAMINKSWNPHAFTKALGMGAFSGALGGAIGLVGSSLGPSVASSANKFAFNLLSQTTNSIATNAVFGGDLSFKSILGITAGAALGSVLPNFKAIKGGALVNGLAETGYNTARGAVTGFGQGLVNAALCKDADYIWQNTAGGAISGFSRSLFMNIGFGTPYQNEYSKYGGFSRCGGIASLLV